MDSPGAKAFETFILPSIEAPCEWLDTKLRGCRHAFQAAYR